MVRRPAPPAAAVAAIASSPGPATTSARQSAR
jgi:hypothetical protein